MKPAPPVTSARIGRLASIGDCRTAGAVASARGRHDRRPTRSRPARRARSPRPRSARRRGRREADARAAAEARARRLLDQRRDAARAGRSARRRARSPSGCASELGAALGDERRADRGRRARASSTSSSPTAGTARRRRGDRSPPASGSGAGRRGERERILVEFVSANPTGPLTAAGGRGAAYGDSLARLLELAGHEVEREYYLNDAGSQVRPVRRVDRRADARRASRPRTATRASTSASSPTSSRAAGVDPDDLEALARRGVEAMRERIEATPGALRGPLRHLVLGARAARRGRGRGARSTSCASAGTSTRPRARSGCGRPTSATTRTGC